MLLDGEEAFLVVDFEFGVLKSAVRIESAMERVLSGWTATRRVSPVYPCRRGERTPPREERFANTNHLLFLGPLPPKDIEPFLTEAADLWITLGLFNLVVRTNATVAKKIVALAAERGLPYEHWRIKDGRIEGRDAPELPAVATGTMADLARFAGAHHHKELEEALREYGPLMAATLVRSASVPSAIVDELSVLHEVVVDIVKQWTANGDKAGVYRTLGQLLTVNAALSRYSSQTYAGTIPIAGTECHFWSHSLLGIGTASLALRNVRHFVQKTIGEARIHERFGAFAQITHSVPDLTDSGAVDTDYLASVQFKGPMGTLVPLLAYFSARDGYRSTELTLSAPLACVASSESQRWSLATMTHEISHVVVRAVLTHLIPNLEDAEDLKRFAALLQMRAPRPSLLHEVQHLFLLAVAAMVSQQTGKAMGTTPEALKHALQCVRHDIDEIMTHVFDFMYFFGSDVERYVQSIWISWGTIPNVQERIAEYAVRTVCAVLSQHLRRGTGAETLARDSVLEELRKLKAGNNGGLYVDHAIDILEKSWEKELLERVRARRQLVKLVKDFVFSPALATGVRSETRRSGDSTKNGGYPHVRLNLIIDEFDNPLEFVHTFTRGVPNSAGSAWLLTALAFGYGQ